MNILKLAAMLTLDGTRFKSGLKEAESAARGFGRDLGSSIKGELAGVFGAGAMVAFFKEAIQSTGALKDLAEQSHMTTDQVQLATEAASDMGMKFEDVAHAENAFNKTRREAAEGNEELRATFAKYGVTLKDLNDPQFKFFDFLLKANGAMKDMNTTEQQRSLTELGDMLGKVGGKLQEFIKQLDKVKDRPIVGKEAIEDIDEAGDKIASLWRQLKGTTATALTSPLKYMTAEAVRELGPELATKLGLIGKIYDHKPVAAGEPEAPGELFADKAAEKAGVKMKDEFEKAVSKMTEASFKYAVGAGATSGQKRDLYELKLGQALDFIQSIEDEAGGASAASIGARSDAFGLLSQLAGIKGADLPVGALTKVGQFGGRSMVSDGDSAVVRAAKEILGVNKSQDATLKEIKEKIPRLPTLHAGV